MNLFFNVQNYISANYKNGYSLYYAKTESTKTMFLLKGLKNGAGDFDVALFAVDANGDFISTFGVNGVVKLKKSLKVLIVIMIISQCLLS